jgi:hypothetical protein
VAFEINGSGLTDPTSYQPDGTAERDTYTDGAPLLQGMESGTLVWAAMSQSNFASLWSAWSTNKGNLVSGAIPPTTGSLSSYRSVTAYFHEPRGEARGGVRFNVTMRVTFIS